MAEEYLDEVDSDYLLDLNLHHMRLELINLLEDCERKECFTCNKLKCICEIDKSSVKSSTISNCCSSLSTMTSISRISSSSENNNIVNEKKTTSITNKSFEEIQAWVQSCTPEKELLEKTQSRNILEKGLQIPWPSVQASIWGEDAFASQQRNLQKQSTVQEFFKKFGDEKNLVIPEVIAGALNVQAIYINEPRTQYKYKNALLQRLRTVPKYAGEYSYF